MGEGESARKSLTEIVLMPLVVAVVGISGTLLVTGEQARKAESLALAQLGSAERLAESAHEIALREFEAQKELKLLEITSQKLLGRDAGERHDALRLLQALDPDFAARLAGGVAGFQGDEKLADEAKRSLATSLVLEVRVTPPAVAPGRRVELAALVTDRSGRPVPGARVTLSAGGGRFLSSAAEAFDPSAALHAPYSASGFTGNDGFFRSWWVCNPCAGGYGMSAEASKPDHLPAKTSFSVAIASAR